MYIEKGLVSCNSCKKRSAVFRRRASGEKLCRLCLYSSIIKQVRKALNYYKMVRKNGSAIFLIMVDKPLMSIAALSIYETAIRDFNMDITVLCFNKYIDCHRISAAIKSGHHKLIEIDDNFIAKDFIEWLKYGEFVAIRIAKEAGIEFIVVPLYRDELTAISLFGLITTSRTIFSEGLPIREIDNVKITRPFYYVVSNDILYLTVTWKTTFEINLDGYRFKEKPAFFRYVERILQNSPELMYSSGKSVELLQSYLFGDGKKCIYCGSYDINDVCAYCERFRKYTNSYISD